MNIQAIVLAAGRGTRMRSALPKVIIPLGDKPMVYYTIKNLEEAGYSDVIVVVGHKAALVKEVLSDLGHLKYALQEMALGTADAVRAGLKAVSEDTSDLLVLNGDDSAFYKPQTLRDFVKSHEDSGATISMLTLELDQSHKLGRVIRDSDGNFEKMLENPDYVLSGLHSREVGCGAYVFNVDFLRKNIRRVEPNKITREYYINSLLDLAVEQGMKINLFELKDPGEWHGINSPKDLVEAHKKLQSK